MVQNVHADANTKYGLHKCILLPILGQMEEGTPFDIYRRIEVYLQESDWCYYRSNSNILTMLQNYRQNLASHLENPEILREIAAKTRSGSLIRITMSTVFGGVDLSMKIIGDNGEDIFFSEKSQIKGVKVDTIPQVLMNWLNLYSKTIPYNGRIIRISGREFIIDIGNASKVFTGDQLKIERPVEKRQHPLLNEVVGWRTETLGEGKIINVSRFQAQVEATRHSPQRPFRIGDWVVLEREGDKKEEKLVSYPELKGQEGGRLGAFWMGLKLGWGSDTATTEVIFSRSENCGPPCWGVFRWGALGN